MLIDQESELEPVDGENEGGAGGEDGGIPKPPKPELTPEQIEGIERRQLTKLAKKFGWEPPKPKPEPQERDSKEKGFDPGELALIEVKHPGSTPEDRDWLLEVMESTNKDLIGVLDSQWVQKEWKERVAARAATNAIPEGGNRSGGGSTATEDKVEYWVAQDKQPPATYPIAFRKAVLDARQKKTEDSSKFAEHSIVAPGHPL